MPLLLGGVLTSGILFVYDLAHTQGPGASVLTAASFAIVLAGFLAALDLRRRLRLIGEALDSTVAPFVIYDQHDRLLFSNARYHGVLGLRAGTLQHGAHYDDVMRLALSQSVAPERLDFEVARRGALHRSANGMPTDRRYPDGAWYRVTKTRTRNGANVGIAIDVSELYMLKGRLQAEVERFTTLANNAPVGICHLAESDDSVRFVNRALLLMLGVADRSELMYARLIFVAGGRRHIGLRALLSHLANMQGECDAELRTATGSRTFLVKKAQVALPQTEGLAPGAELDREGILIFIDISDRKQAEEKVRYLALHDPLTGAGNRAAFIKAVVRASRDVAETSPMSLIAIDLDRFKPINDTYGHATGDEVLKEIVDRINRILKPAMSLFRMGGDEFTIICSPGTGGDHADFALTLLRALEEPFRFGETELTLSASIGISSMPSHTDNAQTLLHYADLASYRAKRQGGGAVCVFNEGMLDLTDADRMLEFEIKDALERRSFELVYQPQYSMSGGPPAGAEVFVRWRRKRTGALVWPADFIALVRKFGLLDQLDILVFERAVDAFAAVMDRPGAPRVLSVNIAVSSLGQPHVQSRLIEALAEADMPLDRLALEVNEAELVRAGDTGIRALRELSQRGIAIVLDDFGTASSSLRLVAELPFAGIKFDSRVISQISDNATERTEILLSWLAGVSHQLGMHAAATGIENEDVLEAVARFGFDRVQGHLLGSVGSRIPFEALPGPLVDPPAAAGTVAGSRSLAARDDPPELATPTTG
ncbi:MAG: hypothetical protein AcusKO_09560 [Acuticoccus sp.]